MPRSRPGIIIGALKGSSGKTMLSLGLVAAWRDKAFQIAPFKKGPDFIDAGWLTFAAGRPCHNLDSFLMNREQILYSFLSHSNGADLSIIEGNRGLYDGLDIDGCYSTAELAKLLKLPVLLVVDVTMATRTMAALIKGCQVFDPEVNIAGVILNRVAGSRQQSLIRNAVERYCGLPVVGSVPKLKGQPFPERHMGLVPYQEREKAEKAISWVKKIARENLQLDEIWKIASRPEILDIEIKHPVIEAAVSARSQSLRIGYIHDKAFWFYYPENLEQMGSMGATLVEMNAISQKNFPAIDALYIGGGFPETQARALAGNEIFRQTLKDQIEKGLPVYAECGGLMYLGERILINENSYPMVGALPVDFILQEKPEGHGYTLLEVTASNPFYPMGMTLKGHEFHYSKPVITKEEDITFVFRVNRGRGLDGRRDGLCKGNLLATYSHTHASGNAFWAKSLLEAAIRYQLATQKKFPDKPKKND